ncbi:hypothetical protein M2266_004239 [Streptomyces sp. SPB162]|nr:hypothetical protein [Streptomyces sp. SPB162]
MINSNVTPNASVNTATGIMMTIAMSTIPMATVLISIP